MNHSIHSFASVLPTDAALGVARHGRDDRERETWDFIDRLRGTVKGKLVLKGRLASAASVRLPASRLMPGLAATTAQIIRLGRVDW